MNTITIDYYTPKEYVKQYPCVDDTGIWVPVEEYVPKGCAANYRLVMTKEMFIEAYNKYIVGENILGEMPD